MTIEEFIKKYNSDNFESYVIENATIDYWNDLIKTYKLEKLNFVYLESMFLSINQELKEGKNLLGKEFDGFCERQIEILNIKKQYEPQQTEFDLTIENLLKFGFNEQEAIKLSNTTGNHILQCTNGKFYFSKLENKFYTGIDFHRKANLNNGSLRFPVDCPDLIPEYYNLALYEFLQMQENSLGLLYNEVNQTEKFISNEIKRSKDIIHNAKESFLKRTQHKFESKDLLINVYESYIYFLEQPQQPEAVIPDEVLLKNEYIKIFKNDIGFTIFSKMFELYKTENTDLANFSFLFYAMEKDFLVCSQTDFIKFLENDKYDVSIEKIDSRQSGKNKKSKLYNSIKETLQKKHEKSTI